MARVLPFVVAVLLACAVLVGLLARQRHNQRGMPILTVLVPAESSATDPEHRFDNDIPGFLRYDSCAP